MSRFFTVLFWFIANFTISAQNQTINLAGEWQVNLDPKNELVQKHPDDCKTNGAINLPGSLSEIGFGYKTTGSDFGILTPEFKYIGKAWYKKQIVIPENWKNKQCR